MASPTPNTNTPHVFEQTAVHSVYSAISPHFHSTRHSAWPTPVAFLHAQASAAAEGGGSVKVGLDAGCGNGKYLLPHPFLTGGQGEGEGEGEVYLVGADACSELCNIASSRISALETQRDEEGGGGGAKGDVLQADILSLPFRTTTTTSTSSKSRTQGFDFALSIAVLHHLSTRPRRVAGVRALLSAVKPGGEILIFVWAVEQGAGSRRRGLVARHVEDEGAGGAEGKDVMVPWVMQTERSTKGEGGKGEEKKVFQRYYHLYSSGELEADVRAAGGEVVRGGWEKDNWWCVCRRGGDFGDLEHGEG